MLPLKSIFIFASKAQLLAYLTSQSAISPISSCETKFLKYGANFEDNFGANDILLSYLSMIINYLPCFFSLKWSGSAATQVISKKPIKLSKHVIPKIIYHMHLPLFFCPPVISTNIALLRPKNILPVEHIKIIKNP